MVKVIMQLPRAFAVQRPHSGHSNRTTFPQLKTHAVGECPDLSRKRFYTTAWHVLAIE